MKKNDSQSVKYIHITQNGGARTLSGDLCSHQLWSNLNLKLVARTTAANLSRIEELASSAAENALNESLPLF
jgi:hypothetical protein